MGRNNIDLLIGKKINRLTLLSESDVRLKQKNKRYGEQWKHLHNGEKNERVSQSRTIFCTNGF